MFELRQLRCFIAVAEEMHFGRAARRLGVLPSALGRHVKVLEEQVGAALFNRTTRQVSLSAAGATFLPGARAVVEGADRLAAQVRGSGTAVYSGATPLRLGVIDTVASGLMPLLLRDLRRACPDVTVNLAEDKSVRLLPRLISGRLDLAIVRPPLVGDRRLRQQFLFHETAVVAVPVRHRFARRASLRPADLVGVPLIMPDRRSRPHSHDLAVTLFDRIGAKPTVAQIAEEKQTIVTLVAAGLGIAVVPRWTARMALRGVAYVRLTHVGEVSARVLPLAAMWPENARDPARDKLLDVLTANLPRYARSA